MLGPTTLIALASLAQDSKSSQALKNFEKTRASIHTARVEWSDFSAVAPVPKGAPPYQRYFTTRIANRDIVNVNHGDASGVLYYDDYGSPGSMECSYSLSNDDGKWEHIGSSPIAELHPTDGRMTFGLRDLRSLGAAAGFYSGSIDEVLWRELGKNSTPPSFDEHKEGALVVVTSTSERGKTRWWLDPNCGWSARRVVLQDSSGKLLSESRTELKQFDGVWYPETVEFFTAGYKDAREPAEIVRIYAAEFNREEFPRQFTASDIGIEPGTNIRRYDRDPTADWEVVWWNGRKVVSDSEFMRSVRAGEISLGPNFTREIARRRESQARFSGAATATDGPIHERAVETDESRQKQMNEGALRVAETEWEKYTRLFISRYKLNDEQIQKAWLIWSDCQSRADSYFARNRNQFLELEKELVQVKANSQPVSSKPVDDIEARREKLWKPIESLFEDQLKPRLDKLPTRAQRAAAEKAPASAPTK